MTLTKEQFVALRQKGLSVEQIVSFESGNKPTPIKKEDGFFKSALKDPLKTLVVKPAVRFGQAIGTGIAPLFGGTPESMARAAAQDVTVPIPLLGDIVVEGQKQFGEGGGKQIIGDAARATSYLYTGGAGATAVASGLKGQVLRGALTGAKTGAVGGGAYSFGEAIQDAENQPSDIAYKTLFGTAIGAATGLTLGIATPIVVKGIGVARRFSNINSLNSELTQLNRTTFKPTPSQEQKWTQQKVDPVKTYSEIFATEIPQVDKSNRFIPESVNEFADKVDTLYKSGSEGFNTILRNSPEVNSLTKIEQKALADIRSSNMTAVQKTQAEQKIRSEFVALRQEHAGQMLGDDNIPVALSDNIKDRYWGATKYFGPEEASVANESNRAIARSFAENIESVITDVNVRNYNKELQRLIVTRDYVRSLSGKLAGTGGKATRLMSRIVGGIAGAQGGPIGSTIGALTGDKLAQILINPEFSPMRWLILKRLNKLPPAQRQSLIGEAEQIIKQMMEKRQATPLLPAPSYIPMGGRTPSPTTISAPEAKRTFGTDVETGQFKRVYTSEPK